MTGSRTEGSNDASSSTDDNWKASGRTLNSPTRRGGSYDKENHDKKTKSSFKGKMKNTAMEDIVLTHEAPGTTQLKEFNEGLQVYATTDLKLPGLASSIAEMEEMEKGDIVTTKLDANKYMTVKSDGSVTTDEIKKEELTRAFSRTADREESLWEKYKEGKKSIWNAIIYQCDDSVIAGMKADKRYKKAKSDVAIIQLLRILEDVINKGEFGARHDEIASSLKQLRSLLCCYQNGDDIAAFTRKIVERYNMQVALLDEMPFGETMMLEIVAASTGADISNITLDTYQKGSKEQKTE